MTMMIIMYFLSPRGPQTGLVPGGAVKYNDDDIDDNDNVDDNVNDDNDNDFLLLLQDYII